MPFRAVGSKVYSKGLKISQSRAGHDPLDTHQSLTAECLSLPFLPQAQQLAPLTPDLSFRPLALISSCRA